MPAFDGRRVWFAGIGGAGMSALAFVTRSLGAEVAGWDRVATPYLDTLAGVDVAVSPEPPAPPDGWEVVVSTAYAGAVEGPVASRLAQDPFGVLAGDLGSSQHASEGGGAVLGGETAAVVNGDDAFGGEAVEPAAGAFGGGEGGGVGEQFAGGAGGGGVGGGLGGDGQR